MGPAWAKLRRRILTLVEAAAIVIAAIAGIVGALAGAAVAGAVSLKVERERSKSALQLQQQEADAALARESLLARREAYAQVLQSLDGVIFDLVDAAKEGRAPSQEVEREFDRALSHASLLCGERVAQQLNHAMGLWRQLAYFGGERARATAQGAQLVPLHVQFSRVHMDAWEEMRGALSDELRAELGLPPLPMPGAKAE